MSEVRVKRRFMRLVNRTLGKRTPGRGEALGKAVSRCLGTLRAWEGLQETTAGSEAREERVSECDGPCGLPSSVSGTGSHAVLVSTSLPHCWVPFCSLLLTSASALHLPISCFPPLGSPFPIPHLCLLCMWKGQASEPAWRAGRGSGHYAPLSPSP